MPNAVLQLQSVGPLKLPDGELVVNSKINTGNPPAGYVVPQNLQVGFNEIEKPDGATVAIIEPADDNTSVLILKGDAGDVGLVLHSTLPTVLCLDTAQTFIVIDSSIDETPIVITWV